MVIIAAQYLFNSDNRFNITILVSLLKKLFICVIWALTQKLYQEEIPRRYHILCVDILVICAVKLYRFQSTDIGYTDRWSSTDSDVEHVGEFDDRWSRFMGLTGAYTLHCGGLLLYLTNKYLKVKGPDIYIPPLTGLPEEQRFTIQTGILTSTSSRWRSAVSGRPLPEQMHFGSLDPQSAARQTHVRPKMFPGNHSLFL